MTPTAVAAAVVVVTTRLVSLPAAEGARLQTSRRS